MKQAQCSPTLRRLVARTEGRTLIEVLVALAIAGMAALLLSSITTLGLRMSSTFYYEDRRVYPARNALDMLVADMRRAKDILSDWCGVTGQYALKVRAANGVDLDYVTYALVTGNRVVRRQYSACGVTPSERVVGNQISVFNLALVDKALVVTMEARSPDGAVFQLSQRVQGRVAGQ